MKNSLCGCDATEAVFFCEKSLDLCGDLLYNKLCMFIFLSEVSK